MFTSQLTESQKAQMTEQYRAGSKSAAVAKRFGCSDRTVMRIVRSRLSAAEMEACKEKNRKRPGQAPPTRAARKAPAVAKKVPPSPPATSKPSDAVAGRLTESQKAQMTEQYRAGSSSTAVAKRFGCSDRTVMRIVRSRLSAAEMGACKEKNRKRPGQAPPKRTARKAAAVPDGRSPAVDEPTAIPHGPNSLPWEDADDFIEDEGRDDDGIVEEESTLPAARRQGATDKDGGRRGAALVRAAKLDVNQLPAPLYLLVERSLELQPRTLGSLHQLTPLDTDEQQRQGLVLFGNVRQARRQCRRNQRIVKVADPKLLGKTAPHLLAQGISRLVVEDALYALPGSAAPSRNQP